MKMIAVLLALLVALPGAPGGKKITVRVPVGAVLHVYPEADHDPSEVLWRCAGSKIWRKAKDNGWKTGCQRVELSATIGFDAEAGWR